MSTDSQQAAPFVFPPSPQDAQITFTITVEGPPSRERGEDVRGEGLLMSATIEPGGMIWDHETVGRIFSDAGVEPAPGEYRFLATGTGVSHHGAMHGDALVRELESDLTIRHRELVTALESFPSVRTINAIARDVVGLITIASLKRLAFTAEPVADAREVQIVGVECAICGFSRVLGIQKLLALMRGDESPQENKDVLEIDGVRFLVEQEDVPVVKIGYFDHDTPLFAPCLNAELARRVHDAITQVADGVVMEIAALNEMRRRLYAGSGLSLHRTYAFDSETLARRALELEAQMRAAMARVESEANEQGTFEPEPDFSAVSINDQPD